MFIDDPAGNIEQMTQSAIGGVIRCGGEVIDERIDEGVEMGGVHVDTGFHRRCPKGMISYNGSHSPKGAIEPRGDRSRGLCSPGDDGSNVAFELVFDTTPASNAAQG